MPQKRKISPTASTLLTLLNNVNDLIVISQKRKEAKDVMKALTIYAENLGYTLPTEKIENFNAVLIDSRPITLSYLLHDIAATIVQNDK
jgi:hypothetical protein